MRRSRSTGPHVAAWIACATAALLLSGCASPGPPRPPSLQLPQPIRNLSATREGDEVELHFTLPQRTTDDLPLRPPTVWATLCRGLKSAPCTSIPGRQSQEISLAEGSNGASRIITWHDTLPPSLSTGAARPLAYRVQLNNNRSRNAGWSSAAYTLAGAAPPAVQDLHAEATSQGILLRWKPQTTTAPPEQAAPAEVLLRREAVNAPSAPTAKSKAASEPVWLATHAEATGAAAAETLDTSAQESVPYHYIAVRRQLVTIDSQPLEMRSAPSAPIEITLRDIFPPPIPTGLSAAGFTESNRFAIDLVWDPVNDAHLAGYNIERQAIDATGHAASAPQRLNTSPIALPAFHDATADPAQRFRYSVTAVDRKGNESAAASAIVEPSQPQ